MRRPKSTNVFFQCVIGEDHMAPRYPKGSRVTFDCYPMPSVDRWACGEDASLELADGPIFRRVASMTPGKSITLIALNPLPDAPTEIVVAWADVRVFAIARAREAA